MSGKRLAAWMAAAAVVIWRPADYALLAWAVLVTCAWVVLLGR